MDGVHVSLRVEDPAQCEPVEHQGPRSSLAAAERHGVGRISYLTGSLVREQCDPRSEHRAKLRSKRSQDSGVPYTFFRPTYFTNTLPRHVQGPRGDRYRVNRPVCDEPQAPDA